MTLMDLCNLSKQETKLPVYPVTFPPTVVDCLKLEVTAGEAVAGGIDRITVQIMSKAKHPAKAEELIQQVKSKMNFTDKDYKEHNIILCKPFNEVFYVGETDTHCHIFAIDLQLVIDTDIQGAQLTHE